MLSCWQYVNNEKKKFDRNKNKMGKEKTAWGSEWMRESDHYDMLKRYIQKKGKR